MLVLSDTDRLPLHRGLQPSSLQVRRSGYNRGYCPSEHTDGLETELRHTKTLPNYKRLDFRDLLRQGFRKVAVFCPNGVTTTQSAGSLAAELHTEACNDQCEDRTGVIVRAHTT